MEPQVTATSTALQFDDAKVWYKSRTMIGSIVAVIALLANSFGLSIDATLQTEVADSVLNAAGVGGGILALYGRILATKVLAVRPVV
jgi:hypothetical protein